VNRLNLASAALLLVAPSALFAQASAPKAVSRADFTKTIDNRFNAVDTNHDGSLSKAEIAAEQQRELQQASARINAQLETKFKQLDTNKDGQLTLREFLVAAPPVRTAETPDQTLQKLDSNHDGKISTAEFRAPQLARFARSDANHDGVVTPAEENAATGRK
jgi:hypothetical protein